MTNAKVVKVKNFIKENPALTAGVVGALGIVTVYAVYSQKTYRINIASLDRRGNLLAEALDKTTDVIINAVQNKL